MNDVDRRAKKLFNAAVDFIVDHGPCDGADVYDDEPYCQDEDCVYCNLAMAVQLVADETDED